MQIMQNNPTNAQQLNTAHEFLFPKAQQNLYTIKKIDSYYSHREKKISWDVKVIQSRFINETISRSANEKPSFVVVFRFSRQDFSMWP